jgi:uroporphyrinogen-III decarboxylase
LSKTKSYKNFILSTGDATAYGTPIENLKAITNIVKTNI